MDNLEKKTFDLWQAKNDLRAIDIPIGIKLNQGILGSL